MLVLLIVDVRYIFCLRKLAEIIVSVFENKDFAGFLLQKVDFLRNSFIAYKHLRTLSLFLKT